MLIAPCKEKMGDHSFKQPKEEEKNEEKKEKENNLSVPLKNTAEQTYYN